MCIDYCELIICSGYVQELADLKAALAKTEVISVCLIDVTFEKRNNKNVQVCVSLSFLISNLELWALAACASLLFFFWRVAEL